MLGGHAALAESEWMGVAQASDVLEPLRIAAPRRRIIPRLPRLRLAGLSTREFTIAEASFVLMASFFASAFPDGKHIIEHVIVRIEDEKITRQVDVEA